MSTRSTRMDITKAPPVLAALIAQQGNVKRISEKLHYSIAILRQMAHGERPIPADLEQQMEDLLKADGGKVSVKSEPPAEPLPITDWDGKRRDMKVAGFRGEKPVILKKMPGPLADLAEKLHKDMGQLPTKSDVMRALGFSNFASVTNQSDDKKYPKRLHNRVIRALRGEVPLGSPAEVASTSGGVDTFKLKCAIVFTPPTNYDRLEEIAGIIGGTRSYRRQTKSSGLILIYRFKTAGKVGQFKRLALRDATEIVCP